MDDLLCIGKAEALELLEKEFVKRKLKVKTKKSLKDYLSCAITMNLNKTKAILRQPHLLKTLEEVFGEMVKNLPKYKAPGTPGKGLIQSETGIMISKEDQKLF